MVAAAVPSLVVFFVAGVDVNLDAGFMGVIIAIVMGWVIFQDAGVRHAFGGLVAGMALQACLSVQPGYSSSALAAGVELVRCVGLGAALFAPAKDASHASCDRLVSRTVLVALQTPWSIARVASFLRDATWCGFAQACIAGVALVLASLAGGAHVGQIGRKVRTVADESGVKAN